MTRPAPADGRAGPANWRAVCHGCGHPRANHVVPDCSPVHLCTVAWCKCLRFGFEPGREVTEAGRVDQGALCAPCAAYWSSWLDYTLPAPPIQLCTIDNSARGVADRQRRRFCEWRDTVRFQQGLTVKLCAEGRHYRPGAR